MSSRPDVACVADRPAPLDQWEAGAGDWEKIGQTARPIGAGQVIGAPNHCTGGRGGTVVMRVNQNITVVRIQDGCRGLFSCMSSPNSPVKNVCG